MASYGDRVSDRTGNLGPEVPDQLGLVVYSQAASNPAVATTIEIPPGMRYALMLCWNPPNNQVRPGSGSISGTSCTFTPHFGGGWTVVIVW